MFDVFFEKTKAMNQKMRFFSPIFQEILSFYGILYSYELIYSKISKKCLSKERRKGKIMKSNKRFLTVGELELQKLREKEKLQRMLNNENVIRSCFSEIPCYWGIDNCVVSITDPTIIIDDEALVKPIYSETTTLEFNSNNSLNKINIQSEDIGKVIISLKELGYVKKYAVIQLNSPNINFETTNIEGIRGRLENVLKKLKDDYNIEIIYDLNNVIFKKIELAFTVAFDQLPSLQTRQLLFKSLARGRQADLKKHRTSRNKNDFSILTATICNGEKHTFYNKIEKAKKNKKIRKNNSTLDGLEVFRYEIELADRWISKKLGSHYLSDLNENKIIQYLESVISLAIVEYIKAIEGSVFWCNKKLKKIYKECERNEYLTEFLTHIIDELSETTLSKLIDEEIISFLPLKFLKSNRASTKRRILTRLQKHELKTGENHTFGKMTSWHVRKILTIMYQAIQDAKVCGLGTYKNSTSVECKNILLECYSLEERNAIFESTIRSNTREDDQDKLLKKILNRFIEETKKTNNFNTDC